MHKLFIIFAFLFILIFRENLEEKKRKMRAKLIVHFLIRIFPPNINEKKLDLFYQVMLGFFKF